MIHRFQQFVPFAGAFLLLAALSGCANTGTTTSGSSRLDISATARSIYEGEIVTVTTRSLNTLGTDASIDWSSTGGDLETQHNGRVARVKFDQPGKYMIVAKLKVGGNVIDTDHVEVNVRDLVDYDDQDDD